MHVDASENDDTEHVSARSTRSTKGAEYHQFQRHPRQNSSAGEKRKRRGWARVKNLPLKSTPTAIRVALTMTAWKSVHNQPGAWAATMDIRRNVYLVRTMVDKGTI